MLLLLATVIAGISCCLPLDLPPEGLRGGTFWPVSLLFFLYGGQA